VSAPGSDREVFLARLRERLSRPTRINLAHPLGSFDGQAPQVRYTADLSDPVSAFAAAAERAMARVRRLPSADGREGLVELLREVVAAEKVRSAVLTGEPEVEGSGEILTGLGVGTAPYSVAAAAEADLGVTGAAWGIAATGSLVVSAARALGRGCSLVPRVHLALLPASRIVATMGDVVRNLDECFPEGLPSALVIVTGPSRSADIELELTLGVHGPQSVWIGLLED